MGRRIKRSSGAQALDGGSPVVPVVRRGNLAGLEGAIAAMVVTEADPALREPTADPVAVTRAKEARKAARARIRHALPREQADAVIADARARAIDLFGIEAAPEQVRARLIEGARDSVAIAHAEGIRSPHDLMRAARGRRLVALADALMDRAQTTLDVSMLRGAAYLTDRGVALIERARADARVRKPEAETGARLDAAWERMRAHQAARLANEGRPDVLAGDDAPDLAGASDSAPRVDPPREVIAMMAVRPCPRPAPARRGVHVPIIDGD